MAARRSANELSASLRHGAEDRGPADEALVGEQLSADVLAAGGPPLSNCVVPNQQDGRTD